MSTSTAKPGTVIHGTLRTPDLLAAFAEELESHDQIACVSLLASYDLHTGADFEQYAEDHPDESVDLLYKLYDALSEHAPEGHYFGSHPGDGSDIGFWPVEDELWGCT